MENNIPIMANVLLQNAADQYIRGCRTFITLRNVINLLQLLVGGNMVASGGAFPRLLLPSW